MSKYFKTYAAYWGILFLLFNVCAFVSRSEWGAVDGSESSFWIGYIFILLTFIGHLIVGYIALKADTAQKMFYNMSLIKISTTGLIVSFIVGILTMIRPYLDVWVDYVNVAITVLWTLLVKAKLPTVIVSAVVDLAAVFLAPGMRTWSGIVSCCIVFAVTAMQCVGASAAIEIVSAVDEKQKTQTSFMKGLTAEAQTLVSKADDPDIKKQLTSVYEAIRYSSPKSVPELAELENAISQKVNELSAKLDDPEAVSNTSKELLNLISERNSKAKLYK